ncbi:MAG: LamG-like jellyroll fold domain-containing protein [Anaerolineae bacterium]
MTCPATYRFVVLTAALALLGAALTGATAVAAPADLAPSASPGLAPYASPGAPGIDAAGTTPVRRSLRVEAEYDAIRIPDAADLNPRAGITISAWVKRHPGSGCGTIAGKDQTDGFWLAICDGRLRFTPNGTRGLVDGSAVIPEGRWTHVAVTYDGNTRRYYINGATDKTTSENARPLAANDSDLVIGADTAPGAAFNGKIDLVRLWSEPRDSGAIAAEMLEVLPRQPGLVAQWTLDGHARDGIGGHDGVSTGGASYSVDGPQPRDITVPLSDQSVTVDGHCRPEEYASAERVALDTLLATRATVLATATDVYVCLAEMPRPNGSNAFAGILLDGNNGRDDLAQAVDYRITVNHRGISDTQEGNGGGGWRDVDLADDVWDAVRVIDAAPGGVGQETWSAEFRFRRSLIDRPSDPDDPVAFGLALTQSSTSTTVGDSFWPVATAENSPKTWALATLATSIGLPPRSTFSGSVTREMGEGAPRGLAGARMQLLLVDEDNLTLVDQDTTDGSGLFSLEYVGRPLDAFVVREIDPRGVLSVSADGGADGDVAGPNVVLYEVDTNRADESTDYSAAGFVDAFGPAASGSVGQHYLVVYASPVEESDLEPLLLARRRQGFAVETISTTELERTGAGRDLGAKIHNWLRAYWDDVEPEPVYALLVGRGDTIPVRDIGWMDNDHRDPGDPDYYPAWPTDWYYADLDSEWDANDNGFYGEFLRCPPGDTYPDAEAEEGESECPEDGSLRREGPFGELRGSADDFEPEISIGRLAVNQPAEVRAAIAATLAFESSTASDKTRALLAGAFWSYDGRTWVEREDGKGAYVPGGNVTSDPWIRSAWDGEQPYGNDSAENMDTVLRAVLSQPMEQVYRLYESSSPGGDPTLAPTRRNPDEALTRAAVDDAWQTGHFGLANFAGNGARYGIDTAHWLVDWTENRRIEQPEQPRACEGLPSPAGDRVGPPCNELFDERFVGTLLPLADGLPPVAVAGAAGTGGVAWTFDGMDEDANVVGLTYGPAAVSGVLAARGRAAAWVGAYADVEPGGLDAFQTQLSRELLTTPLRIGDAVWQAASELARDDPYTMRSYGMQLFGDPAMTYWGSPVDSDGAWPQEGRDWQGTGATRWSGPDVMSQAWEATGTEAPGSPPVIGSDGNLIVVGNTAVARYSPEGDRLGSAPLGGVGGSSLRFSAAIADDAIYVAAGVSLLRFDSQLQRSTTFTLPGTVSGAPRVAPDGAVWVPTDSGMIRVTGNGRATTIDARRAVAPMSVAPDGRIVWPAADGSVRYWSMDQKGDVDSGTRAGPGLGDLTGLSISESGTIYAGTADGRLWAIPEEGEPWQTGTGGPVRSRPVIGADGAVYVCNTRGDVTAYEPDSRRERWHSELGDDIAAPPVVDGGRLYVTVGSSLFALDLATGNVDSQLYLGNLDTRSAPVLGSDRALYVVRADANIVAVGEDGWLAAPTDVAVTVGPTSTTVTWRDNSSEEIGFLVELCDLADECVKAGVTAEGAEQIVAYDLPFEVGEPFYARVLALGRAGRDELLGLDKSGGGASIDQASDPNHASDYGYSRIAIGLPEAPVAPTGLEVTGVGADAVEVTWQYEGDVGELLGFTVSRRVAGTATFEDIAAVGADVRSFADRGLLPDTEYRYRLTAETASGLSPTTAANGTTWQLAPRGPKNIVAEIDRTSVTLRWIDEADDETAYLVERKSPGWSEYQVVGRLAADATLFHDTVYMEEGFYHYRVTALWDVEETPRASSPAQVGAVVTGVETLKAFMPFAMLDR